VINAMSSDMSSGMNNGSKDQRRSSVMAPANRHADRRAGAVLTIAPTKNWPSA
jgi:hypothetical protein